MADFAIVGIGLANGLVALPLLLKPQRQYRHSRQLRDARLAELDEGHPEVFFEERRALEAYTTRYNHTVGQVRVIGGVMFCFGLSLVVWGVIK